MKTTTTIDESRDCNPQAMACEAPPLVSVRECVKTLGRNGDSSVTFNLSQFLVRDGEAVALVGPSGCGKSTLLNLASGLLRPDEGTIEIFGQNILNLSPSKMDAFRGANMGIVYQSFNLLNTFSALNNVRIAMRFGRAIPKRKQTSRALELLDRVGLGHRIHSKPAQLSVGERQRVAIARALANQPRLLLADEPTGSLDPQTATTVFDLILELCAETECGLLFVTHDLELASRFKRRFDCRNLVAGRPLGDKS